MPKNDDAMQAVAVPLSIDQQIEAQRKALQALYDQKVQEEQMRLQALEAAKSPDQKRIDNLERIIEHLDAQIKNLGGHSYKLYL